MLTSTTHQSSLFYFAFDREAALIKDDLLEPIDRLPEDSFAGAAASSRASRTSSTASEWREPTTRATPASAASSAGP
jgi:hypothetical protein